MSLRTVLSIFINFYVKNHYITESYRHGDGLDDRGSIPSRGNDVLFFFATAFKSVLVRTQPPVQWVPGNLTQGVKRPGRETNHSPPCSAEVKNWWSCTSTPSIHLHVVVFNKQCMRLHGMVLC